MERPSDNIDDDLNDLIRSESIKINYEMRRQAALRCLEILSRENLINSGTTLEDLPVIVREWQGVLRKRISLEKNGIRKNEYLGELDQMSKAESEFEDMIRKGLYRHSDVAGVKEKINEILALTEEAIDLSEEDQRKSK